MPLNVDRCRGILPRGGTILFTSRTNPYKVERGVERVLETLRDQRIDALIAIGGEDTLGVAHKLSAEGVNVVGVPKTIDNDLSATEVTFGFHTAVQIATEAIDRLHTTAESHDRVIVCEVMGRHAGWIATYAGIAGGAAEVLVPEEPFDIDVICANLQARHSKGRFASIVVVAEGAVPIEGSIALASREVDQFGHVRLGGIANTLAEEIEKRTGFETRVTILGHIQRGGTPTAFDRVLATRFGDCRHRRRARWRLRPDGGLRADKIVRVRSRRGGNGAQDGRSGAAPRRRRGVLRLRDAGRGWAWRRVGRGQRPGRPRSRS